MSMSMSMSMSGADAEAEAEARDAGYEELVSDLACGYPHPSLYTVIPVPDTPR